jgi:hypothetical protein
MPDEGGRRLLHPVLVSGGGRSGTTLLMLLLGTSPRVVFDRVHPYEHRYLTYLWRWSQLLRPGRAPKAWTQVAMVSRADEMMGPLPWAEAGLVRGEDDFWRRCFLAAWEELSARATQAVEAAHPGVAATHYAEKSPPWLAGELAGLLPCTVLLPVRDPRDVFLSVVSFVDKRGAPGFGMRPGEPPGEFAGRFVQLQQRRLREAARALHSGTAEVVRYEDLVTDLPGQARRLGDLLGLSLDPAGVGVGDAGYQQHSTTASPADSVGRWRREMNPEVRALFSRELAGELGPLGYEP